mmetsp:Transcript_70359/g.178421  ORF Transcript_70359/g.178421 Transcript_70359/m.178421 type:complete len:222 (-) Transcript_70359:1051-1716(-)
MPHGTRPGAHVAGRPQVRHNRSRRPAAPVALSKQQAQKKESAAGWATNALVCPRPCVREGAAVATSVARERPPYRPLRPTSPHRGTAAPASPLRMQCAPPSPEDWRVGSAAHDARQPAQNPEGLRDGWTTPDGARRRTPAPQTRIDLGAQSQLKSSFHQLLHYPLRPSFGRVALAHHGQPARTVPSCSPSVLSHHVKAAEATPSARRRSRRVTLRPPRRQQ